MDHYNHLDDATKRLGTGSEVELQRQRAGWDERRTKMPAVEEKAASLSQMMTRSANALDGFVRAYEREQDYLDRQRRKRDRDVDRRR